MTKTANVNSIIRAISILKSISSGNGKISQIADAVKLTKGTTHRLLATLIEAKFVVQDPISLEYFLGPALLELADNPIVTHKNLVNCASEEMEYLKDFTGETIVLHVISGMERVCIACVESNHNIRYTNAIGFTSPLYIGGAGKILLAELDDRHRSLIIDNIKFTSMTENTITDKEKLLEEIRIVKKQGFATSFGERTAGSSCISVAVRNYVMPVALSVLGPITRFKIDEKEGLLDELLRASREISVRLKAQEKSTKNE